MTKYILVISGSLRKASFTTALCRAVCGLQIEGAKFVIRDYVRTVPMYDGDLDTDSPPIEVADMRRESPSRMPCSSVRRCTTTTSLAA